MRRNTWIASTLFVALCLGGITTMLSQSSIGAGASAETGDLRRSLDPGSSTSTEFGELVPLGIRRGAELKPRGSTAAPKAPVLRLR